MKLLNTQRNETVMDQENVPMAVRQGRLGHSDAKTTMRYSHDRICYRGLEWGGRVNEPWRLNGKAQIPTRKSDITRKGEEVGSKVARGRD